MTSRLAAWPLSTCFKMAATDAELWASLDSTCTSEAEPSVSNLTQYKLFIGEKFAFWSDFLL